jgi:small subunit ribosomal protein S6
VELRKYEIMFILPPEADDQVIQGVTDRISQVLEERGGKVTSVNKWGKRRLAFELNRQSEGFYVVAEFEAEAAAIKELDRVLALVDEVARFKVVVRAA